MKIVFNTISIIGLGLMGGSIAKACRDKDLCKTLIGFDKNEKDLALALQEGVIQQHDTSISKLIKTSDLIIIATPLQTFPEIFKQIKPYLSTPMLITDVGSVKQSVLDSAKTLLGEQAKQFIPAHPIAGSEQHGYQAARADLLLNRKVILTPDTTHDDNDIAKINQFWQALGADTIQMQANQHDDILAQTSHLPHFLASTFIGALDVEKLNDYQPGIGSGFRDFTRIAGSDPIIWRDIFQQNRDALLQGLAQFKTKLDEFEQALIDEDYELLCQLLETSQSSRQYI